MGSGKGKTRRAASAQMTDSSPQQYTVSDFAAEVRTWSNEELVSRASQAILGAAIMSRFSRLNNGRDDALSDAIYDECQRRGNLDLYQRGFNSAVLSQGHSNMTKPITIPLDQGEELMETAQLNS